MKRLFRQWLDEETRRAGSPREAFTALEARRRSPWLARWAVAGIAGATLAATAVTFMAQRASVDDGEVILYVKEYGAPESSALEICFRLENTR